MLKRENRLFTNFEFRITKQKGRKIYSRFFTLYYLKSRQGGPLRVGFPVSVKLAKNAVARNRIKRVFREVVRKNLDKLKPGYWLVIYPKKESLSAKYEEINTDFIKTLSKVPFSQEL